ncbi:succinate dehydrogenase, cytochrome b556 subunit [Gryllotalpicola reticulitermitis]|uniref:Succinate dehydrogenase, cytochrome b556 subunit n=1 Tax=Gryllotalpicola reticulitermitis TaxID=1184153 RepID=A0ABV8Q7Y9_9MICO
MSSQTIEAPKPRPSRLGGTLYRGREGMWSWVLHRITGVAIFFFLLVHILDSVVLNISPDAYNAVIGTYKNTLLGIGEMGLVAAICFHAINGLRIILVDLWGWATAHQRLLFWLVVAIWLVLVAGFVPVQIVHMTQEVH